MVGKLVNNEYAIIDSNLQDEVIIGGDENDLLIDCCILMLCEFALITCFV